jgi:hypothetical protein
MKMRWVEQMSRIEEARNVYKILVGKPERKKQMNWEICASMGP